MIELRDIILIIITILLTLGAEYLFQTLTAQHPKTAIYIQQDDTGFIIMANNSGKK